MNHIQTLIRTEAYKWRGEKEIPPNQGFENPELERQLKEITGWEKGDSWCADMAWLIWYNSYSHYKNSILHDLNRLFSPSAVTSFKNFAKRPAITPTVFDVRQIPIMGSLIYFQDYKFIQGKLIAQWQGHAGVVVELPETPEEMKNKLAQGNAFMVTTIEGNTSESGSREGDVVGLKTRHIDYSHKLGLVPLGFVYPHIDPELEQFVKDI